jgi:hypothetical protein
MSKKFSAGIRLHVNDITTITDYYLYIILLNRNSERITLLDISEGIRQPFLQKFPSLCYSLPYLKILRFNLWFSK